MQLYTLDAFTDRPFAGNPAGVCLLGAAGWPDVGWMQAVAAEMNLSETAFVCPADAGGVRPIRYFAPLAEVELCGHATLASAHLLFDLDPPADREEPIRFETFHGQRLDCRRLDGGLVQMRFPRHATEAMSAPADLAALAGLWPGEVIHAAKGPYDWLLQIDEPSRVTELRPDFPGLLKFCKAHSLRGVVVTAAGGTCPDGSAADVTSRFFAPTVGIDEDPVTGSLQCVLGPYWADRLGRRELLSYQASRRGGVLHLTVEDDAVLIAGHAVRVLDATLRPPATPKLHA